MLIPLGWGVGNLVEYQFSLRLVERIGHKHTHPDPTRMLSVQWYSETGSSHDPKATVNKRRNALSIYPHSLMIIPHIQSCDRRGVTNVEPG